VSDVPLTPDEIAQLLAPVNTGDSTGVKRPTVTQEEINRLLTAINPAYRTRANHTEPLTQDEVNQLLAAIGNEPPRPEAPPPEGGFLGIRPHCE
jgi:hypothetical protein